MPLPSSTRRLAAATLTCVVGGGLVATPARLAAQDVTGTVTGRVTSSDGGPLPGASVLAVGTQRGAISRDDGSYRLQLPAGRYALRARLIGYAVQVDTIVVAAGETVTRDFALARAATALSAVAVVGSRGEARTVVDRPVPVDVLSASDLRTTGRTETAQVIQQLAPSFNFPRPSVTDGTDHVRPATLRGLGPDQVLVLVNGKRRYPSALVNVNGSIGRGTAAVDLNAIPASMIERVEVLREGAAAQYGSDAIAGVINIVLKAGSPGEVTASVGQSATTYDAYGVERDASDGRVLQGAANYGRTTAGGGFFHVGGEVRDREATNRSLGDPRPQTFADLTGGSVTDNGVGPINHRYGDAEVRDAVGFVNGGYTLGGAQFYAFGGFGRREGEGAGFYRRPNDNRTVRAVHPGGFLPLIRSDITDASGAAGVRGQLGGVALDLSTVLGGNTFEFNVANSNNVTLGAQSPTNFYAGQLGFQQSTTNLDASREFTFSPSVKLRTAAGAEFRWENYTIEEGEPDSYRDGGVRILDGPSAGALGAVGAQVFPGFRPTDRTDASRTSSAVYADLETDLTRFLLLTAAGRYEDYSDFGSQSTGRLALRVSPAPQVNFRGTVGTGFRAPSLQQSYFSSTATNFIGGAPFDVRTFPVGTVEAQILGARPLQPETSTNYGVGLALEPTRSLSLTVDYYRIEIDDRIVFSENFTGTDIQRLFEANGLRGVTGGRFFTNAIDTRTRGLDIVANYGINLQQNGVLRLTAGYNNNRTRVTRVIATPPQLGNRGEQLFGRVERGRIEVGQPRDNVLASAVYDRRGLGLTLRTQRYGEVTSLNALNAQGIAVPADQTFGAKYITDVAASYRFANRLTVAVGADNVLDVYPDANNDTGDPRPAANRGGNANFGIFPFSSFSPFGFNGRYVYTRVTLGL